MATLPLWSSGLPTLSVVARAALVHAGIPPIPLHAAQCTTATLLMDLGVDVTVIQSVLVHAQPLTTQRYEHADLTMSRSALTRLADHLT
jgi:site-specific recombinase XerD